LGGLRDIAKLLGLHARDLKTEFHFLPPWPTRRPLHHNFSLAEFPGIGGGESRASLALAEATLPDLQNVENPYFEMVQILLQRCYFT
ncbi:MAG TPA: hypothetical protein VEJ86_07260, partial [Candidatus Binataceae bacterium]|nr:hypothetical protein [Candidatus Binataceae bacterium]